jgi:hypothetical protein
MEVMKLVVLVEVALVKVAKILVVKESNEKVNAPVEEGLQN